MRSRMIVFLHLIVCSYISLNRDQVGAYNNFHFDNNGYYIYLPAIFIYHDLSQFSFQPQVTRGYGTAGGDYYSMYDVNGHKVNKYAIGNAISELPLFLIAHTYCLLSGKENAIPDGYSDPYEYALVFTSILWSFLGLLVLRKFLLMLFPENATGIVLAAIGFGTNFYTYAVFNPGMSHNFSFFLFACLLYYTAKWYNTQSKKNLCSIALILGSIVITRPVNIICILIPLLWGVYSKETLLERARTIVIRWKDFLLAAICFLLIACIQLGYWKYITGHWVYFSYVGEEFNFAEPKILKGLFSYRKGWFVYTPIAFIGLAGLVFTSKKYTLSIAAFFLVMIYVVFSWENWYYGSGFGARAMIETLPVVAVPLAFFTSKVLEKGNIIARFAFLFMLSFFVILNLFQSYQYGRGLISYDRMTRQYYWYIFGKLKKDADSDKYLMQDKEYWDEIVEWNNN